MSRSWERKVRKNMSTISKRNKKSGTGGYVPEASRLDRFRGRNFILPVGILLVTGFYAYMGSLPSEVEEAGSTSTLYWLTIGCYVLLGLLFFLRRPYLTVGREFLQTRKLTGDKVLRKSEIKGITVQPGYIVIEQVKGANWVFSRALNRFPTDAMAERLKKFAVDNGVPFNEKSEGSVKGA